MKLNKKTTVLVGLAFLSISAFWQMYDNVIPLMLKGTFHLNEALTGAVMAADNILALFLLPFFGALSDRTDTRIGRRMPFILGGTAAAVVLMNLLPLLDNRYAAAPSPAARAAFVVLLGLLLIAMGTYRSPAVALMPDVTVKPLRSKGNAIINLMGAVGGVLYLAAASLLYSDARVGHLAHVDYRLLFAIVSAIMVLSVLILFLTIREPALAAQTARYEAAHPEEDLSEDVGGAALPPPVRRSLTFLLLSISLWYIAYNAVTTWFTTYVQELMGRALGGASTCLMVATAGAIVSYIPIGEISSRVGRKRTILGGVVLLSLCFAAGYVLTTLCDEINGVMYLVFALVGLAWAAINVNSLPMVVEMCRGSDVGKFTGTYYTFSMAAQVVTPVLSGWLLGHVGYFTLFPYAALFSAASFVTMLFVRHGDSRTERRRGLEAFDVDD
ncbi:MAG: SLC45 family MFS transporter [Oscillospiraceae bacterium]|jgi:maltose/moltooligosaccharide transporter|nr:SLC45 family MFS transporter [Oscillospiraceae bacterium]